MFQILLLLAGSLSYMVAGMFVAWPNVFIAHIIQNNSTIFNTQLHLTDSETDMLGSMIFLGSLPGFLLAGWLLDTIGRRWSVLVTALPGALGSLLIGFSLNPPMLLVGRFLEGITFGMLGVAVRTYASEIVDTTIRGTASVMYNVVMNMGSVAIIGLGIKLSWYYVVFVSFAVALLHCFLVAVFLVESPTYLAVKNREAEATVILRRLRGPNADIKEELRILKMMNQRGDGTSGWGALIKRDVIKNILVMFGLSMMCNFSGVQVMKMNTVRILVTAGLGFDETVSTIMFNLLLIAGNVTIMYLLDRIGRRRCLVLSLLLLTIANSCFGTYVFLTDSGGSPAMMEVALGTPLEVNSTMIYQSDAGSASWSWVPLMCVLMIAFGQSLGAGPIPYILTPEYFPTVIRSQATSVCLLLGGLQNVAALQLYSPMQASLTQAGLYWTYGLVAAVGIPYSLLFVKETAGRRVG
ncbi:facilitated trehalose transporter Tret1-like [Homarus americanus]|nr:facilitated trehalose transporter Tret1-like [Homarus americanus]